MRIYLLGLQDPAVHLLPLHLLLAAAEGRLALDHLIDEAAQTPVVGAQAVYLWLFRTSGAGGRAGKRGEVRDSWWQVRARADGARTAMSTGPRDVLQPGVLLLLTEGLELDGSDLFPLPTLVYQLL